MGAPKMRLRRSNQQDHGIKGTPLHQRTIGKAGGVNNAGQCAVIGRSHLVACARIFSVFSPTKIGRLWSLGFHQVNAHGFQKCAPAMLPSPLSVTFSTLKVIGLFPDLSSPNGSVARGARRRVGLISTRVRVLPRNLHAAPRCHSYLEFQS